VWDDKYILKVIDIFQYKANRRYYMVTTYAAYGTLFDRIKLPMEEKHVNDFIMRSAEILKYLHYDLLKDYQSSDKDSANS
jgi:serine/threonine protein kinase